MTTEIFKLFVGKGHFYGQNRLARQREAQGWTIARMTEDFLHELKAVEGVTVVLNGADAGSCIAAAAHLALECGAINVVIPLDKIQTESESEDPMSRRADALARSLNDMGHLFDERLIVTPTSIWNDSRARVGSR